MKKEKRNEHNGTLFTATLVVCLAYLTLDVCCAATYAAEQSQDKDAVTLEPVIVTAQKVEENVQDVPASILVFSDTEMEDAGIDTIVDIIQMSPNVIMRKTGAERIIQMRGISINAQGTARDVVREKQPFRGHQCDYQTTRQYL